MLDLYVSYLYYLVTVVIWQSLTGVPKKKSNGPDLKLWLSEAAEHCCFKGMGLLQAKALLLQRERLEVVRGKRMARKVELEIEKQCGFRPRKGTMDAFYSVQKAIRQRRELIEAARISEVQRMFREAMGKSITSPAAK